MLDHIYCLTLIRYDLHVSPRFMLKQTMNLFFLIWYVCRMITACFGLFVDTFFKGQSKNLNTRVEHIRFQLGTEVRLVEVSYYQLGKLYSMSYE